MLTDKTTKKIDWASILPKDKTETDVNMEKTNQINPENILKNANLGYYKDFLIRNQSLKGILKIEFNFTAIKVNYLNKNFLFK